MGQFRERLNVVASHNKFMAKYDDVLNEYSRAYFSKVYESPAEMSLAFENANKEWLSICETANSGKKSIQLNKNAFAKRVEQVLIEMKTKKQTI